MHKRVALLDSLRGVAALIVMIHHIFTRLEIYFIGLADTVIYTILKSISDANHSAVLFFFVLSGVSIQMSLKNHTSFNREQLNDYFYKRFKRILPLYIPTLIFTLIVGYFLGNLTLEPYSLQNFIGNLFFLQISRSYEGFWFEPYGLNGPLWSLSFEMFFYVFFPVFQFSFNKFQKRYLTNELAFRHIRLLGSLTLSLFSLVIMKKLLFIPYMAFASLFYLWYLGAIVGEIYMLNGFNIKRDVLLLSIPILILLGLKALNNSQTINSLFTGSFFAIGVYLIFYFKAQNVKNQLMNNAETIINTLFMQIGHGSFTLYLIHYPVVMLLMKYKLSLILMIVTFVLLIIFCIAFETYIKKKKFDFLKVNYIRTDI